MSEKKECLQINLYQITRHFFKILAIKSGIDWLTLFDLCDYLLKSFGAQFPLL